MTNFYCFLILFCFCELACLQALGMESGAISNAEISASSKYNDYHAARLGRLYKAADRGYAGGWRSLVTNKYQWLQLDLMSYYKKVTRVATQGEHNQLRWVTAYNLKYGNDENHFKYYKERGQNVRKVKYVSSSENISGNSWQNIIISVERSHPAGQRRAITLKVEGCITVKVPYNRSIHFSPN